MEVEFQFKPVAFSYLLMLSIKKVLNSVFCSAAGIWAPFRRSFFMCWATTFVCGNGLQEKGYHGFHLKPISRFDQA